MASQNVKDWDLPLPTPENISERTQDGPTSEQSYDENLRHLVYKPSKPVSASPYTEYLAKPRKRTLTDNAKEFAEVMSPSERSKRLQRLARKHCIITVEQLEEKIRSVKDEERKKEDILKRKEQIYYELLTKMELQSKTQYLNLVLNKFSNFIAKLSTTMPIPSLLFDPHARMQRGLFCNILHTIGVENFNEEAITYYNSGYCSEYAVCRKLSHALLSLIIKALDLASTYSPNVTNLHSNYEDAMDNLIKSRLMQAAQKKILKCEKRKKDGNMRN